VSRVKRVIVGEIGRPHGVRGLVRLRAFTADPTAIASYGPLTDEAGTRRFAVAMLPDGIARIEGVADRDQAAKLTGTKLFAERDRLPPPEDPEEFFLCDLEGLPAFGKDGAQLGTVRAVEDHGAGPFLVVDGPAGELLLPFTKAVVPVVDVAGGRIVIAPPDEIVVPPQPGEEAA
jgi:16S rRNA processing protein RimM